MIVSIRFVLDLEGKDRCRCEVVDNPPIVGGRQLVVHVRKDGQTKTTEFEAEMRRTIKDHGMVVHS